jgi:hypothetical protein
MIRLRRQVVQTSKVVLVVYNRYLNRVVALLLDVLFARVGGAELVHVPDDSGAGEACQLDGVVQGLPVAASIAAAAAAAVVVVAVVAVVVAAGVAAGVAVAGAVAAGL